MDTEFLSANKEWLAALGAVVVALLSVFTAKITRKIVLIHRHENSAAKGADSEIQTQKHESDSVPATPADLRLFENLASNLDAAAAKGIIEALTTTTIAEPCVERLDGSETPTVSISPVNPSVVAPLKTKIWTAADTQSIEDGSHPLLLGVNQILQAAECVSIT